MKKAACGFGILCGSLVVLWILAGRPLTDLGGYFRASAQQTVDHLEENVPQEVQDRKLSNEIQRMRQDLIDRQVKLNLARNQHQELKQEVQRLTKNTEARKHLLNEAYLVLKKSESNSKAEVSETIRFANTEMPVAEFQSELDDLLTLQERELRQLQVKQSGLDRLTKNISESELALDQLRDVLDNTEQEVALLKTRRDQAELEAETLQLLSSVASRQERTATAVKSSLDRLRNDVEHLEAENLAVRELAPVDQSVKRNRLNQQWDRFQKLEEFHQQMVKEKTETEILPVKDESTAGQTVSDESTPRKTPKQQEINISLQKDDRIKPDVLIEIHNNPERKQAEKTSEKKVTPKRNSEKKTPARKNKKQSRTSNNKETT